MTDERFLMGPKLARKRLEDGEDAGEQFLVPSEVAAAIKTRRVELLTPLRNRIMAGDILDDDAALGMVGIIEDYIASVETSDDVRRDLVEGIKQMRETTERGALTPSRSLILVDFIERVITDFEHVSQHSHDHVSDGQARATAPFRIVG